MEKICINKSWEYVPSVLQNPLLVNLLKGWKKTDLPHDYTVEVARSKDAPSGLDEGFTNGAGLYYRKTLTLSQDIKDKRAWLEFEGIAGVCEIWVNKQFVAKHSNPYTSVLVEVSDKLNIGDNEISLHVDNRMKPNSRWYVGCGLYRSVNMYVASKQCIPPYGLKVTTTSIKNNIASIKFNADVNKTADIKYELIDVNGNVVGSANGSNSAEMTVKNVTPWSAETPYLYTARTTYNGDIYEIKTGIRTISVDSKNGLRVNGVTTKLKGGCIHHDLGLLGAADYKAAELRRIKILKESGFNAIRLAHNPYGPAIFEACDELGMYCIEEAFDEWVLGRTTFGLHLTFEDKWEKDLTDMITRDYNHPSIIMWSTGNEVEERDGSADGFAWAQKLANKVKSLDGTRPVSASACALFSEYGNIPASGTTGNQALNMAYDTFADGKDIWGPATEKYFAPLDVAGYNYKVARYAYDGEKYPDRVIYGSETYPRAALLNWLETEKNNNVIGDFVWTAWDYLGEVGVGRYDVSEGLRPADASWPWLTSNCSDIDLLGNKRPQSFYRDVVWDIAKKPKLLCLPPSLTGKKIARLSWGWLPVEENYTFDGHEGKPMEAHVYGNYDEVELIQNGVSIGKRPCTVNEEYKAKFELTYASGELIAVGYINGKEVARDVLTTCGKTTQIKCLVENVAKADGYDLTFVQIQATDENGIPAYSVNDSVNVSYTGGGKIIAVGSANPKTDSLYPFTATTLNLYCGKAMVVIRSAQDELNGELKVEFNGATFNQPIKFEKIEIAQSQYVLESKPSAIDLTLGELMSNEKALAVLKKYLGILFNNPMLQSMKGMPLNKLLSMGGMPIPNELKTELNEAMGL